MNGLNDITNDPFDPYPRNNPLMFDDEAFAEFSAEWEQFNNEWREAVERLARQATYNICPLEVDDLAESAAWVAEINEVMPAEERFDDDVKLVKLASEMVK